MSPVWKRVITKMVGNHNNYGKGSSLSLSSLCGYHYYEVVYYRRLQNVCKKRPFYLNVSVVATWGLLWYPAIYFPYMEGKAMFVALPSIGKADSKLCCKHSAISCITNAEETVPKLQKNSTPNDHDTTSWNRLGYHNHIAFKTTSLIWKHNAFNTQD